MVINKRLKIHLIIFAKMMNKKTICFPPKVVAVMLLMVGLAGIGSAQVKKTAGEVFSRDNLSAWCIVPYDSKKRNAAERAQMLQKMGIKKFAYDWRDEHVPFFDDEMKALKKYDIELEAFWMPYGSDPVNSKYYRQILDVLARHHIQTQLWWSYGSSDEALKDMTQEEKVKSVSKVVKTMAEDAAKIGCKVGLYNHSGWFGEPENQLAIINHVKMPNVGIVYNFNHAEEQVDRFPDFFPKILPHLIALNIAGLQNSHPGKVVAVGQGDGEQEMIRIVATSSYDGTIGIINEDTAPDAEEGLSINIEGLKKILQSLGYTVPL